MSRGAYRAIHTVVLDGPDFQAFTAEARHLFYALKLNLGATGIDVLYPAMLEPQTGYSAAIVERALRELEAAGWLRRERNVCWLVEGLANEPSRTLANANHRREIEAHADGLPRLPIVDAFRAHYGLPVKGIPAPSTLSRHTKGETIGDGMGDGIPKHGEREEGRKGEREEGKPPCADALATAPPTAPRDAASESPAVVAAPAELPAGRPGVRTLTSASEPPWFADLWAAYPKRSGSNSRIAALEVARARARDGEDPAVMLAGTQRYHRWAEVTGKLRTELVMQAQRFYGPKKHYLEAWETGDDAEAQDVAAAEWARMEADDAWLATRRAMPPVPVSDGGGLPGLPGVNGLHPAYDGDDGGGETR